MLNCLGNEVVAWSRVSVDRRSVRVKGGEPTTAPTRPTAASPVPRTTPWWWLGCRRLGVRDERRADLLRGLLHLACALIWRAFLPPSLDAPPQP